MKSKFRTLFTAVLMFTGVIFVGSMLDRTVESISTIETVAQKFQG